MPSKTKEQKRLMCWALAYKKDKKVKCPKKVKEIADSMTLKELEDFCGSVKESTFLKFEDFLKV